MRAVIWNRDPEYDVNRVLIAFSSYRQKIIE